MHYTNKHILVAPLDWGLGHAGRCIPLIKQLLTANNTVVLAGSGDSLLLLEREFPQLKSVALPSYNIRYPKRGNMVLYMLLRAFAMRKIMQLEHKAIREILSKTRVDIIISDNRFGCFSKNRESVIITHQVRILLPWYMKPFELVAYGINKNFIKQFDYCWIPDVAGVDNISGKLSHSWTVSNAKFIGLLPRFGGNNTNGKILYDILILLSGPEPQRSILEEKLIGVLQASLYRICLVRATSQARGIAIPSHITVKDLLGGDELEQLIFSSARIITRSGYSTIMDLLGLHKDTILIPTPGQTEQEYLAQRLNGKYCFKLLLQRDIEKRLPALLSA